MSAQATRTHGRIGWEMGFTGRWRPAAGRNREAPTPGAAAVQRVATGAVTTTAVSQKGTVFDRCERLSTNPLPRCGQRAPPTQLRPAEWCTDPGERVATDVSDGHRVILRVICETDSKKDTTMTVTPSIDSEDGGGFTGRV